MSPTVNAACPAANSSHAPARAGRCHRTPTRIATTGASPATPQVITLETGLGTAKYTTPSATPSPRNRRHHGNHGRIQAPPDHGQQAGTSPLRALLLHRVYRRAD